MTTASTSDIVGFLALIERAATHFGLEERFVTRTIEGFILVNGQAWTPTKRPRGVRKMRAKQCYSNSMRVLADRPDLSYCEGYALSAGGVLPVMHGWLVNEQQEVVDPTWEDSEHAAYFGLVIPDDVLMAMVLETNATGFLASDYAVGHPCRKLGRLPTAQELRTFAQEVREQRAALTRS